MKKQILVLALSLSLFSCGGSKTNITLNSNNVVSFDGLEGHFSDADARTYTISKGQKLTDWFTLQQGGCLSNDSAYDNINYTSITVDYILKSSYGYLTTKTSQYAITSPENGANELTGSTTFTFEGNSNQYFSLYAAVGDFAITSIVLTYDTNVKKMEDPTTLDFYSINDTHGAVEAAASNSPKQVGIEKLAGYLRKEQKAAPESSVVLSSGDMWQGTASSNLTKGMVMVDWMNVVGFESMAVGNHEFDWTPNTISLNSEHANFPFLGINIVDPSGRRPGWAQASKVIFRGGRKIGIIGAIGNLSSSIAKASLASYSFRNDYASLVHDEAERLRTSEGCSLVVLSIHNGSFDTSSCHNIDAVFEGHSHQGYNNVDSFGIPHVQCTANGSMLQKVSFNLVNGKLTYASSTPLTYNTLSSSEEDSMALGVYGYYDGKVASLKNMVVGHTSSYLSKEMLVKLAAETSYRYYANKWDSEVVGAFLNSGSARQGIEAGDITYGAVYQAFPFDNDNVIYQIKGSDFANFLDDTYLTSYTPLERSAIESERIYKVMILNYVGDKAEYAPYLSEVSRDSVTRTRDIVADYFTSLTTA